MLSACANVHDLECGTNSVFINISIGCVFANRLNVFENVFVLELKFCLGINSTQRTN